MPPNSCPDPTLAVPHAQPKWTFKSLSQPVLLLLQTLCCYSFHLEINSSPDLVLPCSMPLFPRPHSKWATEAHLNTAVCHPLSRACPLPAQQPLSLRGHSNQKCWLRRWTCWSSEGEDGGLMSDVCRTCGQGPRAQVPLGAALGSCF